MTLSQITIDVELTEEEILADLVYPAAPEVVVAPVPAGPRGLDR